MKATPAQTPSETVPEPTTSNGMAALSAATAERVNAGVTRAREEDLAALAKTEPKNSPLPLVNDKQDPSKGMKSEWDGPAHRYWKIGVSGAQSGLNGVYSSVDIGRTSPASKERELNWSSWCNSLTDTHLTNLRLYN